MSLRNRPAIAVTAIDNENISRRPGKAVVPRPLVTRRPALGELGNKLPNQDRTNVVAKKPVSAKPIVKQTIVKTLKETTTTVAVTKVEIVKPETRNDSDLKIEEISHSTRQLIGVIDADVNDKDDPFLVSEYIQDIFSHLRSLESEFPIRETYLATHRSNPRMRSVLVNWMVDVHLKFKFLLETLHLSVAILDRYLQLNNNIGRQTLQLVGTTAMIIAAKYEEVYMPVFSDFEYICDNTFTHAQFVKMELEMLAQLDWNLGRPLSLHFLRRYNRIARVQPDHHNLGKYLLEIFLLEYELCHVPPSVQAAAACCLSISILNDATDPSKVWNKTLAYYSTYKYSDIKPVVLNLAFFLSKMEKSKYQAVYVKYAGSNLGKVSLHRKIQGPLVQKLSAEARQLKKP